MLFFQVLSVVGDYHGRPVALFTAIMTTRRYALYKKVMQIIKQKYPHFRPMEIMADYEWACRKALRTDFPRSRLLGCR